MNEKKTNPRKDRKAFFIRQVSRFSPKRLHIEIPSEHTQNIKAGDYVEVRRIKK
jgi:hypothetical protein